MRYLAQSGRRDKLNIEANNGRRLGNNWMIELARRAGEVLLQRGWTVGTAESCTGGLIAAWLTEVPGCSAYVLGGIVAYSNAVKHAVLGVRESTLETFGAVSEETAAEMATGARNVLSTTVAVSVTGIAGPGGGTPGKPVGLTFIGLAGPKGIVGVERHMWPGDRAAVREASTRRALEMILEFAAGGE